nr:putative reverse transcriptase domain-containing protein [Tanacetum cinerariifolium]
VVRFGKREKLNLRYVGPFKVLERVGDVAYKLDLLEELSRVHSTFHVSNLKKYHADEPLAVPLDGLHFDDKLHFVEELVEIVDREIKRLKRSRIPLVKGADEELSDGGSLRVIVYGYDGLPMMLVAPPSPDYIPSPEEPQIPPAPQDEDEHEPMFIQPHDLDFVPEPIYPEYIPLEDEHILSAEKQPLPPVVSPTAESPGYVAESDPEEDPEEYEEDETEDGPVDYPMDGGDDDDGDSSGYDADDEDEEEEEEHLAPPDSAMVIPIDELVSLPKGTEPTIPPPSTDTAATGARITIRPRISISLPPKAEVERLLAMPTPSPSPLTSLSPPSAGERLDRCMALAALPLPPLPPSSYPLPPVDRRDGIPKSEQPPRKRLCLATLGPRYEVGESSTRGRGVDYGFADTVKAEIRHRGIGEVGFRIRDTWIDPTEAIPEMAPTTLEKRVSMDSQRVDLLMGDRMTLQETVWIVEEEAYAAREAWAHLVGLSQTVNHKLQTLREQIMAPVTRQGQNPPPPNTNTPPHHMTPKSVQAMIDQPLLRNSTNGDGSQSSHEDNLRHEELKKLEIELWNLKVKGNDVPTYTNRFQELTLICTKFVTNENKKIDKYISGLPDNIYGDKLRTNAERADNKRKTDDTSRNNHRHQQQPFKKQNVAKKCHKCNKVGHFARDCRSSGNANVANAQRDGKETPKGNGCFKCGASGHFKRHCPKLKNKNEGNRNAQGWVYVVGNAEKNGNAPVNPGIC